MFKGGGKSKRKQTKEKGLNWLASAIYKKENYDDLSSDLLKLVSNLWKNMGYRYRKFDSFKKYDPELKVETPTPTPTVETPTVETPAPVIKEEDLAEPEYKSKWGSRATLGDLTQREEINSLNDAWRWVYKNRHSKDDTFEYNNKLYLALFESDLDTPKKVALLDLVEEITPEEETIGNKRYWDFLADYILPSKREEFKKLPFLWYDNMLLCNPEISDGEWKIEYFGEGGDLYKKDLFTRSGNLHINYKGTTYYPVYMPWFINGNLKLDIVGMAYKEE